MAKKTADKAPEPMDASAPERAEGKASDTNQRTCYAARTLVEEVSDLFPEVGINIENYNGRNVGLDVVIDASMMDNDDAILLYQTVGMIEDQRVRELTTSEDTEQMLVSFHNNPRVYDGTEGFGLGDALLILSGDES